MDLIIKAVLEKALFKANEKKKIGTTHAHAVADLLIVDALNQKSTTIAISDVSVFYKGSNGNIPSQDCWHHKHTLRPTVSKQITEIYQTKSKESGEFMLRVTDNNCSVKVKRDKSFMELKLK